MFRLYVTEYRRFGKEERGTVVRSPATIVVADEVILLSDTAKHSSVFTDETRFVELDSDGTCHIRWCTQSQVKAGTRPDATVQHKRLRANHPQLFTVEPSSGFSVIAGAAVVEVGFDDTQIVKQLNRIANGIARILDTKPGDLDEC